MIGTTLGDIRDHIEALASEQGEYYLVCGRYGDRPVPAANLRFESRPTARAAAQATEQYRTALRRYDPQLPYYDVIVCQETTSTTSSQKPEAQSVERTDESRGSPDAVGPASDRESLIDFCHAVAGAVFETIADSDHAGVEQAIMDTYLDRAETIDSPDELCLRLLESMATELDERLTPDEQVRILTAAATRLSPPTTADDPLDATLSHLRAVSLVSDYTLQPCSIDLDRDVRSWDVTLSGYALDASDDRLATLPLVIDLFRRRSDPALSISRAEHGSAESTPSTWCFRLTAAAEGDPTGLVSVPEVSTE